MPIPVDPDSPVARARRWPIFSVLLACALSIACSRDEEVPAAAEHPPAIDLETTDALEQLGYLEWADADPSEGTGVVRHERDRAWPGLNLYSSRNRQDVALMDNDGAILHRWVPREVEVLEIAHALPNGDIILVDKLRAIIRLSWDSTELWRVTDLWKPHHDLDVAEDGTVFALSKKKSEGEHKGQPIRVNDQPIAEISPDGVIERKTSLLEALGPELVEDRIALGIAIKEGREPEDATFGAAGDILHTNSIDVLDGPTAAPWSPGSLLLSVRNISRVVVVDRATGRVAWATPPDMLAFQHDATRLPNGNVLVFDNRPGDKRSRVVEIDPTTDRIVWRYEHEEFFSRTMGGAQRLPNDNVLISESNAGRCFEVTRSGEIVWEFLNDEVDLENDKRATIYRMRRLPADFFGDLMDQALPEGPPAASS